MTSTPTYFLRSNKWKRDRQFATRAELLFALGAAVRKDRSLMVEFEAVEMADRAGQCISRTLATHLNGMTILERAACEKAA